MRRLVPLLVPLAIACLPVAAALADPFPVANTADSGAGSLRAAITAANGHGGADKIPIETTGTIKLLTELPAVSGDVEIVGPGAGSLTVARSTAAPFFGVLRFFASTSTVSGITVRGGVAATGAGILNGSGDLTLVRVVVTGNQVASEGGPMLASGGGIFSKGSLTLRESTVSGNKAIAGDGDENIAAGGGIEAEGSLLVERSTISDNLAWAFAGIGHKSEAIGGGVAVASGVATIEESTVSGNTVRAQESSESTIARGGGVWGSGLTIAGSTIAGNVAAIDESATAVHNAAGDNLDVGGLIRNSIVADPQGEGDSCANSLLSGGFNLDEDGSCGFGKSTDLSGVVAGLEPLADNGGPTFTHALRADGAAIDRGNSFNYGVDQRGLPRPSDFPEVSNREGGDGSDIGAFELQVPLPAAGGSPVVVTERRTDGTPPQTRIVSGPPRSTFKTKAKFRFASTEAQSHFQCRLDKKKWKACVNPFKRAVKPGKHLFKVRAIDRFGNVDPTPARFGWRVKPIVG